MRLNNNDSYSTEKVGQYKNRIIKSSALEMLQNSQRIQTPTNKRKHMETKSQNPTPDFLQQSNSKFRGPFKRFSESPEN